MARFVVAGLGAVGARVARQVHSLGPVEDLVLVSAGAARADEVVGAIGAPARRAEWTAALASRPDAVVLCGATGQAEMARAALEAGAHVVATADVVSEVEALLALDGQARTSDRVVAAGAGFSPGLACVLARHAAAQLDSVEEVRVASAGTGGPACARHHHAALGRSGPEWDGAAGGWTRNPGGGGRELCWFPDPAGAQDCYRGELAAPLLLRPAFPGAGRISARRAASRRDRLTARLPMLRRPHQEGLIGALRVEVAGRHGAAVECRVLGAIDRPAVAAGAVAALTAHWAVEGLLAGPGAGGLATLVTDTAPFLRRLAERGVKAAALAGAGP